MKRSLPAKQLTILSAAGALVATLALSGSAAALAAPPGVTTPVQTNNWQNIITKGNQEITRRLGTLGTLSTKISGATKLSASDKSYLSTEVTTEISGLTSLKTQLDGDTTATAARTDAESIFTEYRVYALVLPKVWLIKTADDQQLSEGKLSTLATKLQTQISADQTAGKDVASLQTQLNDMTTQITNAQAISSSIESKVLMLQPSDYDSDHTILSGDAAQLKTAHGDNETAYSDAKNIVASLKTL